MAFFNNSIYYGKKLKQFKPTVLLLIIMTDIIDIINNITNFFNERNIKFVIGGSYAIKQLAEMFSIENDVNVNNIDIFYLENTPITPEYIYTYQRVQTAPCTSLTYITKENYNINITMCRVNSINYINYNNIKFMHPLKILSYYQDDFNFDSIHINKIKTIDNIIVKAQGQPRLHIVKQNMKITRKRKCTLFNSEPIARRLFRN
jgi:hypothetical protein